MKKELPKWQKDYREWWLGNMGKYTHPEEAFKAGYEYAAKRFVELQEQSMKDYGCSCVQCLDKVLDEYEKRNK